MTVEEHTGAVLKLLVRLKPHALYSPLRAEQALPARNNMILKLVLKSCRVLLVSAVAVSLAAQALFAAVNPQDSDSAHAALKEYDLAQLLPQSRRIVRGDSLLSWTDVSGMHHIEKGTTEIRQDSDGRYDFVSRDWLRLPSEQAPTPVDKARYLRRLWTGKALYEYFSQSGHSSIHVTPANLVVGAPINGYLNAPLDGTLGGDSEPFSVAIKDAPDLRVDSQTAVIDGCSCIVLLAKSKSGSYRICLDPAHGYVLRSAKVIRSGNDEIWGQRMSSVKPSPFAGKLPSLPTSVQTEDIFLIDQISVKQIEQHWVPTSAVYTVDRKYSDGRTAHELYHIQRTCETFSPDFIAAHAFVPEFPNGTQVIEEGLGPISFEWKDGKVQAAVDDRAVHEIARSIDSLPNSTLNPATAPSK